MILWVLKENRPSIGFYEKMGGKIVASQMLEMGKSMETLGYGYKDLKQLIEASK